MVNEINSVGGSLPGSSRQTDDKNSVDKTAKSDNSVSEQSSNPRAASSDDKVNLSEEAKEIARIQRALAQLPDIDEARIKEIRDQIANGSYTIDVEALAEKILADDQFFGS